MSQAPVAQWKSCRLQIPSHSVPSVKLCFLQNFTLYLRNSWSLNLRATESCICGLRPIERKMRSILQTVYCYITVDLETRASENEILLKGAQV